MVEFSIDDLIKRLLKARIANYNTILRLVSGIGVLSQFKYLFRFTLDSYFRDVDYDGIRTAVEHGDITDPDIVRLLEEGDCLYRQVDRLILQPTPLDKENARQGALQFLRKLEGEVKGSEADKSK